MPRFQAVRLNPGDAAVLLDIGEDFCPLVAEADTWELAHSNARQFNGYDWLVGHF